MDWSEFWDEIRKVRDVSHGLAIPDASAKGEVGKQEARSGTEPLEDKLFCLFGRDRLTDLAMRFSTRTHASNYMER